MTEITGSAGKICYNSDLWDVELTQVKKGKRKNYEREAVKGEKERQKISQGGSTQDYFRMNPTCYHVTFRLSC